MIKYDKSKPLISLHIPKTGGTSFTEVLRNWYGDNLYLHYSHLYDDRVPRKFKIKEGFLFKKYKPGVCIHGHFNMNMKQGAVHYYPFVDQFITILRDPFKKMLSNYHFTKLQVDRGEYVIPQRLKMLELTLEEYVSTKRNSYFNFFPRKINRKNYRELIDKYFIYIGLMEDYQTSVDILSDKLGFESIPVPHKNSTKKEVAISDWAKQEFNRNHEFEYEVYNYVKENYKNW
ncbi:MAG: sulfotransferase family 2 domain-containing protein [Bacteroidota bacterium]